MVLPIPFKVSPSPKFINTYINAGITIPPTAAIIGRRACLIFDNSPCKNSLLISSVTKKKKLPLMHHLSNAKLKA